MAWRLARSLQVLEDEVESVAPGTTFWTIGDADHQDEWSDHNPNAEDVVCAGDVLGDAGLDLAWFANTIVDTDPPALKYVIYERRIWFPGLGWQPYGGQFHSHVHVSVGWGPDGRSTGPYDDQSPWGLLEEDDMATEIDLIGTRVKMADDDGNRWSFGSIIGRDSITANAALGYGAAGGWQVRTEVVPMLRALLAQQAGEEVAEAVRAELDRHRELLLTGQAELAGQVAGLRKLLEQLAGADPVPLTEEQLAALTAAVEAAARDGAAPVAAALAAAGEQLAELAEAEPA